MIGRRTYRAILEAGTVGWEITIRDNRDNYVTSGWALTHRGARRRADRQMRRARRDDARRELTREYRPDPDDA